MKLELKHLAPYLPYGLKTQYKLSDVRKVPNEIDKLRIKELNEDSISFCLKYAKPILRPLSNLTKKDLKEELYQYYETLGIDVKLVNYDSGNDNPFDMTLTVTYKMMGEVFTDVLINRGSISQSPYHVVSWLLENNFDVFRLIEKGLAIDINTL